jgi:hypothetical protein
VIRVEKNARDTTRKNVSLDTGKRSVYSLVDRKTDALDNASELRMMNMDTSLSSYANTKFPSISKLNRPESSLMDGSSKIALNAGETSISVYG